MDLPKLLKTYSPQSTTKTCVVHHIRNASRYVVWKDKKAFAKYMKEIYNAPTKDGAEAASNGLR